VRGRPGKTHGTTQRGTFLAHHGFAGRRDRPDKTPTAFYHSAQGWRLRLPRGGEHNIHRPLGDLFGGPVKKTAEIAEYLVRLCIACQSAVQPSETFIRAHLEQLPHQIVYLHGYGLDYTFDGQKLRQWYLSHGPKGTRRIVNLLPRFIEFRLRRRLLSEPSDVDIVAEFLRQRQIDLVLAEYGTTGAFITPACRMAGIPLVVHFHGFDASENRILQEFESSYQRMFAYASKVIVVSEAMRQKLLALQCSQEKLVLNHYGPDPSFFSLTPNYRSNEMVAVGRLTDKKAPHLLLLAFRRVLESCPELRLRIVGDGKLRGVCEDLITALGLVHHVVIEGGVSPATVRERMAGAYLFAQHSVVARDGDSEGTPVAILEAGAAALPVVATRHAGIPDVIIAGTTGILVDERDVAGMADAVIALARDRSRAQAMGEAARRHIASHFTMDKHLGSLNDTLQCAVKA
jgi:colanic acid/amylovoran biosynthesis glycosyltransferase